MKIASVHKELKMQFVLRDETLYDDDLRYFTEMFIRIKLIYSIPKIRLASDGHFRNHSYVSFTWTGACGLPLISF